MSNSKSSSGMALARWGVSDRQLTSTERWLTLACMFFFGSVTMFGMIKCAPILPVLGETFGMGLDTMGNIMAFFSTAGIVVAIPTVWIMRNLGIKFSLIATAVITLAGSFLGLFAQSAGMFLFSRVLEGCGMGMIAAIGPNVMPRLFAQAKQGIAMGVWSVWTTPGLLTATLVGPQIYIFTGSWQSLWWLSIVLEVVAIIWLLISCKMNKVSENELLDGDLRKKRTEHRNYLIAGVIASASFFSYAVLFGMFQTFYPTFLQEGMGMDIATSALPATGSTIISIPISIVAGILIARFNARKWTLVAMHVFLAVLMGALAWQGGMSATPWITMIGIGLAAGVLPVALRMLVPFLVTEPRKMDYVLGIMALVTNCGAFMAGPWGALVSNTGWTQAGYMTLLPFGLVVAAVCAVFIVGDKKVLAADRSEAIETTET
jgi:predicted MFS family arabinose efflux permease